MHGGQLRGAARSSLVGPLTREGSAAHRRCDEGSVQRRAASRPSGSKMPVTVLQLVAHFVAGFVSAAGNVFLQAKLETS